MLAPLADGENVAMPVHDLLSRVHVPLAALTLKLAAPPSATEIAVFVVVVRPVAPPTVIVSVADTLSIVITSAHTPLPVGVTVYWIVLPVPVDAIVATLPQLIGLKVGSGLAIVVEAVTLCGAEAADAKASVDEDSESEPAGPGGPEFGTGLGATDVVPPPQPAKSSDAVTAARRERRRKVIERFPLDRVLVPTLGPRRERRLRPRRTSHCFWEERPALQLR
jgi:hypothetical protein